MGYGYPLAASVRYEILGAGTGLGTTITSGSGAKGTYATLGTTTFDYDGFFIDAARNSATIRGLIDIAVNNGGSDQVVVPNLLYCGTGGGNISSVSGLYIPVKIPSGAVVKARWQANTGTPTLSIMAKGMAGDSRLIGGGSQAISLTDFTGVDPTNTLTLTGTTQTGWTQIVASSSARISAIIARITDAGTALGTTAGCVIDIGWGAAASERVLQRWFVSLGSVQCYGSLWTLIPCDFPSGTRFAFRAQASAADTNVFGLVLNGIVA